MKPETKQLLWVFGVGAVISILAPSLVSPAMVILAMGITLLIQKLKKKSKHTS